MRALPDVISHNVNDKQVTEGSARSSPYKGTFLWVGDVVAARGPVAALSAATR